MSGLLLVRSGGGRLGLPVEGVLEVVPVADVLPAPAGRPAVRGLLAVRDRLVPLVHLRALLDDRAAPPARGDTAVVVQARGRRLALEVDAAEDFVREAAAPLPAGWDVPWADGVVRRGDTVIAVVQLEALAERLVAGAEEL